MKITSYKIFRYSVSLTHPLIFNDQKIVDRTGLIVILKADSGHAGVGEIAPLVGFSKNDVEKCFENLDHICSSLINRVIAVGFSYVENDFRWIDEMEMIPEVRFGVEAAIFNVAASINDLSVRSFFSGSNINEIMVNGLVFGQNGSIRDQVEPFISDGFKVVKIKAGEDVTRDIERVKNAVMVSGGRIRICVDANQKWNFSDAVLFAEEIGKGNLYYIEEPFFDISMIPDFFKRTGVPIALDETLSSVNFDCGKTIEGIKFWVIKPTLLGGIRKTFQLIAMAKSRDITPVISSSFESSVGLTALVNIAACSAPDIPAGLDTLKWLRNDLIKEPLVVSGGKIRLPDKDIIADDICSEFQ